MLEIKRFQDCLKADSPTPFTSLRFMTEPGPQ